MKLIRLFALLLVILLVQKGRGQDNEKIKLMTERLNKMADSLSKNLKPWKVPSNVVKVETYGAVGDSQTVNTKAIQAAIDACSEKGGGVVLFSKGGYVSGTLIIKSGVMLEIAKNAKLLGSVNIADYPEKIEAFKSVMSENHAYRQSLIYAEKCTNIGIRGKGEIYFRGELANFPGDETLGKIVNRPFGIRMVECTNVVVQDIFLHNSAAWMQNYLSCRNMIFDGMKVVNQANYNNDGLDPDGCVNVIIRNCYINAEDDAMCLKGASGKPTRNVLIENSTFYSSCNALKTGTDTQGDFFDFVARNLTIGGIPDKDFALKRHEASSGITLATVDGGNVHDILIHNITINNSRSPLFIRIGNRLRAVAKSKPKEVGYLKDILIKDVKGEKNYKYGSLIMGIKEHPISEVYIQNYNIQSEGGGEASLMEKDVPENEGGYPDARFFLKQGAPAYGFYVRYAKGIYITNANITNAKTDARPFTVANQGTSDIFVNGKLVETK